MDRQDQAFKKLGFLSYPQNKCNVRIFLIKFKDILSKSSKTFRQKTRANFLKSIKGLTRSMW